MEVLSIDIRQRDDFERGFILLCKWRADSMYVTESAINARNRKLLAEFATSARLVTISGARSYAGSYAEAGMLICYGVDYANNYRRAASYVDKILKGAKPGDIPIEQPTKFELIVNRKTAKTLGIAIPPSLELRADEVIE
jgi:putative ABC transport system substrate-binding protein